MPITPTPEPPVMTMRGQGPVHTKVGQGPPRPRPSKSQPPPPFSPQLPLQPPPQTVDPRELMPTSPRGQRAQPAPPPAQPVVQPRAQPQPLKPQKQPPQATRPQAPLPKQKKSAIRPWMVILLILVAGGIAAGIVALSGPDVAVEDK